MKMSYLKFLYVISQNENKLLKQLNDLLKLVLVEQEFKIDINENENVYLHINEIKLNERDFDKIKDIILSQNLIKHSDELIDSEIEQALEKAKAITNKGKQSATLEEQIISFWLASGQSLDDIKNLTIYQFNSGMERLNLLKSWEVYTYPAIKAGESNKIEHWLSHIPEKGEFDDVTMSLDQFQSKAKDFN